MNELVSGGNCPHPHIGWSVTYPDIWMEVAQWNCPVSFRVDISQSNSFSLYDLENFHPKHLRIKFKFAYVLSLWKKRWCCRIIISFCNSNRWRIKAGGLIMLISERKWKFACGWRAGSRSDFLSCLTAVCSDRMKQSGGFWRGPGTRHSTSSLLNTIWCEALYQALRINK